MGQRDLLENTQYHPELDHKKGSVFFKAVVLSRRCAIELPGDLEALCLTTPAWEVRVETTVGVDSLASLVCWRMN